MYLFVAAIGFGPAVSGLPFLVVSVGGGSEKCILRFRLWCCLFRALVSFLLGGWRSCSRRALQYPVVFSTGPPCRSACFLHVPKIRTKPTSFSVAPPPRSPRYSCRILRVTSLVACNVLSAWGWRHFSRLHVRSIFLAVSRVAWRTRVFRVYVCVRPRKCVCGCV